jgi:hypothetical protein
MGRRPARTTLEYLLGSRARAQVMCALFRGPHHRPWLREICRHAGSMSAVRRELQYWHYVGLIHPKREGGAVFYEVDFSHPLASSLRSLVCNAEAWDRDIDAWPPKVVVLMRTKPGP